MHQRITLNITYDQPKEAWDAVMAVYKAMSGWLASDDLPRWFGTEADQKYIWASVEPGGIVFEAAMDAAAWEVWLAELCARLSTALGRTVQDAEL